MLPVARLVFTANQYKHKIDNLFIVLRVERLIENNTACIPAGP